MDEKKVYAVKIQHNLLKRKKSEYGVELNASFVSV